MNQLSQAHLHRPLRVAQPQARVRHHASALPPGHGIKRARRHRGEQPTEEPSEFPFTGYAHVAEVSQDVRQPKGSCPRAVSDSGNRPLKFCSLTMEHSEIHGVRSRSHVMLERRCV